MRLNDVVEKLINSSRSESDNYRTHKREVDLAYKNMATASSIVWQPTEDINGFQVRPGDPTLNGATLLIGGVNFTFYSTNATSCELVFYHRNAKVPFGTIPIPDRFKIGYVWSIMVFGLNVEDLEYTFRMDGPYDPSRGLYFDKNKELLDPYARAIVKHRKWGEKPARPTASRARVTKDTFHWDTSHFPNTPMEDSIIYEMHVRGFTMHESSDVIYPGTFAGIIEKVPYLKELGVTAVELMPIFEFDEVANGHVYEGKQLLEYWGYNTVGFFAPNSSYAASAEYRREGLELKEMIQTLKENGIEVILDVVFNHTAEGNEKGPYISFRGMDNNVWYMLSPDGSYYNFSGCGNTVNCNHPVVQEYIVECLRYWVTRYHIDGFRFDLASILGRDEKGKPMENPPLLQKLAFDPILGNVKLIAEAWDAGGMYQVGSFPAYNRWAEWNGKYRDSMRDYLKGNHWAAPEASQRITGSLDLYYGVYKGYTSSVNFLTCHDGFTLYDLYSYNQKSNYENGWDNNDGANDNRSWNCGVEGETDDPRILALRFQMMRNAMTTLMCSRGTPMILAGDEFGNTQYGNNNGYCQDNEISWLDWTLLEQNKEYYQFCKDVIRFRKKHSVISRALPKAQCGLPPIEYNNNNPDDHMITSDSTMLGVLFAGFDVQRNTDDAVYLVINPMWTSCTLRLPALPADYAWGLSVDTGAEDGHYYYNEPKFCDNPIVGMGPRRVCVFSLIKKN